MAYMDSAVPVASDFDEKPFLEFLKLIRHHPQRHRKLWEWAFIHHHCREEGMLRPGKKGLGFGVGREKLPCIFAARGCSIVATDGPAEIAAQWSDKEYTNQKWQLFHDTIIDEETFERLVYFQECDMKKIDQQLIEFDFCWSACAFEHLGNIDAGIEFVLNSLTTLKIGGIAVHTTEFNVGSNIETVEFGPTVLYRRKDIERLVELATTAGHKVRPLPIQFGDSKIDRHVDIPPYVGDPHLKLAFSKFVTTSLGVVIERGA